MEKALAAADMAGCQLINPTKKQRCRVTGASYGYTATAQGLSSEERDDVIFGRSKLSEIHNRRRVSADQDIARVLKKYGAECVAMHIPENILFAMLDRATAPAIAAE
jgi:hypothetical protein